jgi:uncharacterized protein YndB with AHSA1/START domain
LTADSTVVARVTHRFDASPERVFDAWLDPVQVRRWFSPGLGELQRIETDPRVGGRFSFVDRRDGEDIDHIGEYLEIDRPNRLVFTWGIVGVGDDTSTVTIEITPLDTGCVLTLTHEMDARWADYVDRTIHGWTIMLEAMDDVVEDNG